VSGASEIIKDGENGFIFDFDKNKAKNLAQKMQILLDNPEILTDLSNNAFKSIQKMNWSNFYQAFTEILKS
jgi:glycosyltransferase involved in cell wall biosynthesis